MSSRCLLCEETRCLENAHLVPRHIFKPLPLKLQDFHRTVLLCPTHHRCFDHFKLTQDEFDVLRPYVDEQLYLVDIYLENYNKILNVAGWFDNRGYRLKRKRKKQMEIVFRYINKMRPYYGI